MERIEELEEALRESVQITAEREMVLAQEEAARSLQEKQVYNSPRNKDTHTHMHTYMQQRNIRITPTAHIYVYTYIYINKDIDIQIKEAPSYSEILSPSPISCHWGVSHPFFTSLLSSGLCLFFSSFIYAYGFLFVFSLLHIASQKHSLKPMHEYNLAHLKWSKV